MIRRWGPGCVLTAGTAVFAGAWGFALYAAVVWRGWWLLALIGVVPVALVIVALMALAMMCACVVVHRRCVARAAYRIARRVHAGRRAGDWEFTRFMRHAGADDLERLARQLLDDKAGRR